MPQLDISKYISQVIYLVVVFSILYYAVKAFLIPKISNTLNKRNTIFYSLTSHINDIERKIEDVRHAIHETRILTIVRVSEIKANALKEVELDFVEKQRLIEVVHESEMARVKEDVDRLIKTIQDDYNVLVSGYTSSLLEKMGFKADEIELYNIFSEINKVKCYG